MNKHNFKKQRTLKSDLKKVALFNFSLKRDFKTAKTLYLTLLSIFSLYNKKPFKGNIL